MHAVGAQKMKNGARRRRRGRFFRGNLLFFSVKKLLYFVLFLKKSGIAKMLRIVDPQALRLPCGRDSWPILGGLEGS